MDDDDSASTSLGSTSIGYKSGGYASVGEAPLARRYAVLGSTGNVYTVRVGELVSCDCPDAAKGNVCKHQLFIFLRVLRQPRDSPLVFQRALLSSERAKLFASPHAARGPASTAVASSSVVQAYSAATGKAKATAPEHRGVKADDCPICFEALGSEALEVCTSCRNGIHADCFRRWSASKAGVETVPCPLCRAPWPAVAGGKGRVGAEGFINLAEEAGVSEHRPDYWGIYRSFQGYGSYRRR